MMAPLRRAFLVAVAVIAGVALSASAVQLGEDLTRSGLGWLNADDTLAPVQRGKGLSVHSSTGAAGSSSPFYVDGDGNLTMGSATSADLPADTTIGGNPPGSLPTGSATTPFLRDADGDGDWDAEALIVPDDSRVGGPPIGSIIQDRTGVIDANQVWILESVGSFRAPIMQNTGPNCGPVGTFEICSDTDAPDGTNVVAKIHGSNAVDLATMIVSSDCTAEDVDARGFCLDNSGADINDVYADFAGAWIKIHDTP